MTEQDGRGAVAARGLTPAAVGHLTSEVAMELPFEDLALFKDLLKRFFSPGPWTPRDADSLSRVVSASLKTGWWEHQLDDDLVLRHGIIDGRYEIFVTGADSPADGLFDRVFAGPVVPEATPHPMKVKFDIGGVAGPGVWYLRGDEVDDPAVARMLAEPDVTDVMVAGDFVTIGLARGSAWEDRLDEVLELVTELFYDASAPTSQAPARTRDELVGEGLRTQAPAELHLLDPDDPQHRATLTAALRHASAEVRRVALATIAQSTDGDFAAAMLTSAYDDRHRIVRRMAVDGAADLALESLRPMLERALGDDDPWTRWKAIRGLREIGAGPSREIIAKRGEDDDFQVRFEAAAALNDLA